MNEEIKSLKKGNEDLLNDLLNRFGEPAKFELRIKTLEGKTEPKNVDMIDTQDQSYLETEVSVTSKEIGQKGK